MTNCRGGGCNKISDTNVIKSIFFNFVKNTTPPPPLDFIMRPKILLHFEKRPPYFTTIFHYIFQKYPPVFWRVQKFYDIFQIHPPNFITHSKILLHFSKTPPNFITHSKILLHFAKTPPYFMSRSKISWHFWKIPPEMLTRLQKMSQKFYYICRKHPPDFITYRLILLHFSKWPPLFLLHAIWFYYTENHHPTRVGVWDFLSMISMTPLKFWKM